MIWKMKKLYLLLPALLLSLLLFSSPALADSYGADASSPATVAIEHENCEHQCRSFFISYDEKMIPDLTLEPLV